MFTNRLFNLLVAAVVVILAIQFTSVAVSPAAGPIDSTAASKYEDRYDRMNQAWDADPSYIPGDYEDRYDFMNDFPGTDR